MQKQPIEWRELGFSYQPTNASYVLRCRDGVWEPGFVTSDHTITISECAGVLHYAQACFEGLKAYTTASGRVVTFRPRLNAQRLAASAQRLVMPVPSEEAFLEGVRQVVAANLDWVPPYGTGASLYIRPVYFAVGDVLGVQPATAYELRFIATPVGPYFKGGVKPIALTVSRYDRAAPHGTGAIKAGLNYAMSLYPLELAHEAGYNENLYLDAATRTYVEETGGANLLFVRADGTLVVPVSATNSILPSITRRSLVALARDVLGMAVEERPVAATELKDFVECGVCGTAAVLCPVARIDGVPVAGAAAASAAAAEKHREAAEGASASGASGVGCAPEVPCESVVFSATQEGLGPVLSTLRHALVGIQEGTEEDTLGWLYELAREE
jgi:branched-chain amino acid aminotransferase